MRSPDPKHPFTSGPRDVERVQAYDVTAQKKGTKPHHFTARLTIGITSDLRDRIKLAAFRRGITIAEMLRDPLSREFPRNPWGAA